MDEDSMTGGEVAIEAVRARVREVMEREKRSIRSLADEIGMPNGTLSPFLAGSYQGDNEKIAEKVQRWLETRPVRGRVRATMPTSPDFVETPAAQLFIGVLEHAHYMPDFAVVVGAPGVGKTQSAEFYRRRHPNVWMVTVEPCGGSVRAMLELIAEEMKVPTAGFSAPALSRQIALRLRGLTGLIIVDEAQHLAAQALDQLRTIYDRTRCGVVLLGNETIYSRLEGGGRAHFAQLTSRVGMRVVRMRPEKADVAALLDAWGITDDAMRRTLAVIANKPGALRVMDRVLKFAHKLAGGDGEGTALGIGHIQSAYARLSSDEELRPAKGVAA